jgi:hypothetical protein
MNLKKLNLEMKFDEIQIDEEFHRISPQIIENLKLTELVLIMDGNKRNQ